MSADWRQQMIKDQEEQEIRQALARVSVGLGGKNEAQILALALGSRFSDDNRKVTHE